MCPASKRFLRAILASQPDVDARHCCEFLCAADENPRRPAERAHHSITTQQIAIFRCGLTLILLENHGNRLERNWICYRGMEKGEESDECTGRKTCKASHACRAPWEVRVVKQNF